MPEQLPLFRNALGFVGILTANPLSPLHIVPDAGGQCVRMVGSGGTVLWTQGGVATSLLISSSTVPFNFGTDASATIAGAVVNLQTVGVNRITVLDTGLVGLGISPSAALLHIKGNATSEAILKLQSFAAGGTFGIDFRPSGGGPSLSTITLAESGTELRILSASGRFMTFYTNGVESARITSTGFLGVGMTPTTSLHVKANSAFQGIRLQQFGAAIDAMQFDTDGSGNARIRLQNAAGTTAIEIDANSGGTTYFNANQMVVGGTVATTSTRLDVQSTTRAFCPPRMTTSQKNAIASPSGGMIVYDTTLAKLCVYGAAAWETITSI